MYKMLVLDMDGTLLNENQEISQKNIIAIEKAKRLGVKVVLATGRSIYGIEKYLKELDLISDNNYSVTCSGALVLNNSNKRILQCNNLSVDEIKYIIQSSKKLNLKLNFFSGKNMLIDTYNLISEFDSIANNLNLKTLNLDLLHEENTVAKATLINEDISIIEEIKSIFPSICLEETDISFNKDFNRDLFKDTSRLPLEFLEKFTVVKTTPFTYEIIKKNINKKTGIEILAEELHIIPEEIICIGDSGNDIHMIEYAGLGVAMGNAFEEIKESADYITCTNKEDGVAHVIEKFILDVK